MPLRTTAMFVDLKLMIVLLRAMEHGHENSFMLGYVPH